MKARLLFQILATGLLLFKSLYFGPIGLGAGLVDGLVIYTIWFNQWEKRVQSSR